jgi:hypothetical protein
MKICPVEAELFHADRGTERWNFKNTPKRLSAAIFLFVGMFWLQGKKIR